MTARYSPAGLPGPGSAVFFGAGRRLATAWVVRTITLFVPDEAGLTWGSSSPRIFTNRPKDSEFNWPGRGECERRRGRGGTLAALVVTGRSGRHGALVWVESIVDSSLSSRLV